jgi:hypothetical protein
VLAQCPALAHLDLRINAMGAVGAERIAGVLAQCPALAHLNLGGIDIRADGQGALQECWGSVQRWPTSMSVTIWSDKTGLRALDDGGSG